MKADRDWLDPQKDLPERVLCKLSSPGQESDESFMTVVIVHSLKASALLLSNLNWLGTRPALPLQPLPLPLPSGIPPA